MIEALLPPGVACSEIRGGDPGAALLPEEAALLGRAVEKRVREFTEGRHCARMALRRLGLPAAPILRGEGREPLWPAGIVGSITHCEGYRAAAVARASAAATLGIDAEIHAPLPQGVARMVLVEEERDWLARAPEGICWDRVIFSAKESVFKAWWPLARRWLDFGQAAIALQPEAGRFEARLLVEAPVIEGRPLAGFAGRWLVEDGLVLTAIALPTHTGL
ncbi:MAG: 4'-phosphopantetheinyl transferase superfamily protein [Dongiaceae bacterium]